MECLYRARLFSTAVLLSFSAEPVFNRTTNFIYKKGEHLELSHHLYLARANCITPIQCAVACMSTTGCVLADVDPGNLYKKVKAHKLKTPKIQNYVESQENKLDEYEAEAKTFGSFFMVTEDNKPREVYKMSLKKETTQKTGITVNQRITSLAYEPKSNMLFWSEKHAIYKQSLEANAKRIRHLKIQAHNLNINKDKIVYVKNTEKGSSIFNHDLKKRHNLYPWFTFKCLLYNIAVDVNILCFLHCQIPVLSCVDESTKDRLYQIILSDRCVTFGSMALVKASGYGMLVYTCLKKTKFIEITTEGHEETFSKPKTIGYDGLEKKIDIFPGLLVKSVLNGNKVEFWEMGKDGHVGRQVYSMRYPSFRNNYTVLVEFLRI